MCRDMMRVSVAWGFVMPCLLNQQLGELLRLRQWRLAVAESCTGGGLASRITAVGGSSAWFDRGFVTYQAAAKTEMLGVNESTLRTQGQVSAQTALEMAEGVIRHSHAQIALSITGIAGPTGAVAGKPVGTVFFGMALKDGESQWRKMSFAGSREMVRESAIQFALSWLIELLEQGNKKHE